MALAGLALAGGILSGCGTDQGADDTAEPAATVDAGNPGGYGAPPATTDATTSGTTSAGATSSDAGGTAEAAGVVLVISDFTFEVPDSVPAGATITIRNEDGVGHTVTSDDGAFDVTVAPGEEATLTAPAEAGDYPFHCTPHPQMTATLTVEG